MIFRLYTDGANTYQNWSDTPTFPYNSTARDKISDPDGACAKNEITSIPSPFARIDLIKTAFKEICKLALNDTSKLDGSTIFHKMISDSLDVGEIFFNIDKYRDKIEIITWQPTVMINQLLNSENSNHYCVADSLKKYLIADATTYNFGALNNIYLLNYIHGPEQLNIIGATSPATLFFSGANSLDYVDDIFFSNNDKPFDGAYQPLYKRDHEYIKTFWVLSKMLPNFSQNFPEIDEYLRLTYKAITDQALKNELNQITNASVANFAFIDTTSNNQNNYVEVLGFNLLKKKAKAVGQNQFTINPDLPTTGAMPMVLPVEKGNKYANLQYTNGCWGVNNKAPYIDYQDIASRTLPFDGSISPYLTISDFLEDYLITIPHSINEKHYFNGGISLNKQQLSYLLPIKPLYFKYFTADTLLSTMPDGKRAFEMEAVGSGSIKVTIRIPIVGNVSIKYIEYIRVYYASNKPNITSDSNEGGIAESNFTGFVMPCKRFEDCTDAIYTVSCISTFSENFQFDFYEKDQIINDVLNDCRNTIRGAFDYKAITYTFKHHNFDFIRVTTPNGINNLIVPIFTNHQSLEDFEFAIDLGTSNTHIEYKKSNENTSEPFNLSELEISSPFFKTSYRDDGSELDLINENELIDADYFPKDIGGNNDFIFPTRTALSYAKTTDWNQQVRPFGLANLSMTYNKRQPIAYNKKPALTDIKWSNQPNAQSAMQTYIENIMLLIRNKVVANDGILSHTKITWFYPNSMSPRRLAQLRGAWNKAYTEMFNNNGITINISESIAPIQFYFKRYATATNLINVDIGGGTTDIAFANNGIVNHTTSFKFAANTLFKDSFTELNTENGIIDYFKDDIYKILTAGNNDLSELAAVFNDNDGHPADMASFLFSLKENSATRELAENMIDFNKILQNDSKFKIVFIVFYTAIIYHIAQISKSKNLEEPRHIAFSGNGSKIISIISPDTTILSNFTKKIFEYVLGRPYPTTLEILGFDRDANPKESTCKGGLLCQNNMVNTSIDQLVLKDSFGTIISHNDNYASIGKKDKEAIIDSVKDFFDFALLTLPKNFNLDRNFGVEKESIDIAREVCKEDLNTYLDKGLSMSINETGNINSPIEDALSFYPIKGVLNALSIKIYQHYKKQQ